MPQLIDLSAPKDNGPAPEWNSHLVRTTKGETRVNHTLKTPESDDSKIVAKINGAIHAAVGTSCCDQVSCAIPRTTTP
jgi:hypothetical protein